MRRLLLASTIISAALAGSALAADLPMRAPAPAPYATPIFTWTGFYVGVNGGYAGDRYNYGLNGAYGGEEPTYINGNAHISSSGFVGGGQIGYNFQLASPIVLGIEADIQASGIKGEVGLDGGISGGPGLSASVGSKTTYFGTVRGRLGWAAFDRMMIYATGGFAYGQTKSYYDFNIGDDYSGSKSNSHGGWTVGGGMEYAILPNWSIKAEYLYVDLGKKSLLDYSGDGYAFNLSEKTRFNVVRAGINYRF